MQSRSSRGAAYHLCDCPQLLEMEQRVEDRYDFVPGISMLRHGVRKEHDHTCRTGALHELISRVQT